MMNKDPDSSFLPLVQTLQYKMTYLAGSVLAKKDLERSSAQKAQACIIMTSKNSKQSNE
jgi:hypothetical protein